MVCALEHFTTGECSCHSFAIACDKNSKKIKEKMRINESIWTKYIVCTRCGRQGIVSSPPGSVQLPSVSVALSDGNDQISTSGPHCYPNVVLLKRQITIAFVVHLFG